MNNDTIEIGWCEWCALNELGLPAIKFKTDTGAATSSIYAFDIRPFDKDGTPYVRFKTYPINENNDIVKVCEARIVDQREVKNSGGFITQRYVIRTTIQLADKSWEIDLTLADREKMLFRMLLGREAMNEFILVKSSEEFLLGKRNLREVKKLYPKKKILNAKKLQIGILASNKNLYSNQRILEEGEKRGHEMHFLNIKECYVNITAEHPQVYHRSLKDAIYLDAIIPRIRPAITYYGTAILRQFEMMNSFCLNGSDAILRSRDKLESLQVLSRKGLDMPVTGYAYSPKDTKQLIKMVGGAPLVIKLLEGTQGVGVVLAETNKAAESVINAFKSLKAHILVQEFIKEAGGEDIRCFVVGEKVIASMMRKAPEGEFRANVHLGGSTKSVKITPSERKIAIAATKAMGLKIAGVDIIRSNNGPKILEINSSPGLEGIEKATAKNIAAEMMEYIEKRFELVT